MAKSLFINIFILILSSAGTFVLRINESVYKMIYALITIIICAFVLWYFNKNSDKKLKNIGVNIILSIVVSITFNFSINLPNLIDEIKIEKIDDIEILSNACDDNNYASCEKLGRKYLTGQGTKQDSKKALELLTKACNNGYLRSCCASAYMYQNGFGVKKDDDKAEKLYKKASDGNYECLNKNFINEVTNGADINGIGSFVANIDIEKAIDKLLTPCDKGVSQACFVLGSLYYEKQDYNKAFDLLTTACDDKYAAACSLIGVMFHDEVIGQDWTESLPYFQMGCDGNDWSGCAILAELSLNNNTQNLKEYLKKSCDLGKNNIVVESDPEAKEEWQNHCDMYKKIE